MKTNFWWGEIKINTSNVLSKIFCYKNYFILRICEHTLKKKKELFSHHYTQKKNSYIIYQATNLHQLTSTNPKLQLIKSVHILFRKQ